MTRIPDSSKVSIYPVWGDVKRKLDALVPVSRPARWSLGLYRRGSSVWLRSFILIVLTESKKCREDVSATVDTIAIAHDDDLQFIEGVVCPTQNAGTYTRS